MCTLFQSCSTSLAVQIKQIAESSQYKPTGESVREYVEHNSGASKHS